MTFAILVDVTKCTGCERCVAACVKANDLDSRKANLDRFKISDGLSSNRLLSVPGIEGGRYARKSCMHCEDPSCVAACLVGGISKTEEGPVVYDPDKCIGCRYCMLACPFHIPRYEWEKTIPYMKKCDMCFERIRSGRQPACVEACPNRAISFGERQSLIKTAKQIIRKEPGLYKQHVWGEREFGGTSVLYVSDVDLGALGWPDEAAPPIPELTEPLISKTPFIGLGVASCLLGVNWVVGRRMKLAGESCDEETPEE